MGMISAKNFLAPLTNKVHLITIIIVATAFAMLRLMGGGIRIERLPNSKSFKTQPTSETKRSMFDVLGGEKVKAREGPAETRKRSGFDDIVDSVQPGEPPVEDSKENATDNKRGGLDDIEQRLGLK